MKYGTRSYLRMLLALCVLLFVGAQSGAEESIVDDSWAIMQMAGDDVGWIHMVIVKKTENGRTTYRTESETKMELKRFNQTVEIAVSGWTLEDERGRIISGHQATDMSENETLHDLTVNGSEATLTVTTMGKPRPNTIPWEEDVLGSYGIWMLRKEKGKEPGTKYSVKTFLFDYSKVVNQTLEIVAPEETELLDGEKRLLNCSISTVDILPGVKTHEWWDDNHDVWKTSTAMMGITIGTQRAPKERALKSSGGELKADMIIETMARANVNLPRPYRLDSILYRFKAKSPDLGIPEDLGSSRQTVTENDGRTALVLIESKVPDAPQKFPLENPPEELAEFLEPNAFIQSDHPPLRKKALELVSSETDAWKAAVRLERFVFEHIADKNFGTGFATAAEVFENPCGDCSEHGVLLAALCRAVGIPSRVAVGYMYLGGIFGGHMWAEVWINGEWYAIDGVMGIGRVDPTHITFSTSSIKGGGMAEEFTGMMQALGNLDVSILEFTHGDKTVVIGDSFKDYVIDGDKYTNTLHGISITKPSDAEFDNFERDFSGPDFTLVEIEHDSDAKLLALPGLFSQSIEDLEKQFVGGNAKVLSRLPRKVSGHDALVYMIKRGSRTQRVLAVGTEDTFFVLEMRIEDEERDLVLFEKMAGSITIEN